MHFIESKNAILVLHYVTALRDKHFNPSYVKFQLKIKKIISNIILYVYGCMNPKKQAIDLKMVIEDR